MSEQLHYSMLVQWSVEDQAYLVQLPEWEGRVFGPVTHGDTYEEAVKNAQMVLAMLLEVAEERGEALPSPHVFVSGVGVASH